METNVVTKQAQPIDEINLSYRLAAVTADMKLIYHCARHFHQQVNTDITEIVSWYQQTCDSIAEANYYLGCMYIAGSGCVRDDTEGYRYLSGYVGKASQHDDPLYINTTYRLARMAQEGYGTPANIEMAFKFYTACATYARPEHEEYAETQYQLGYHYQRGEGTAANPALARQYYQRTAGQQHQLAQVSLSFSYSVERFFTRNQPDTVPSDASPAQQPSYCIIC